MRTYFLPRNSLRLISFPVVLGSVKSGAFSPISTAVATLAPPSTLATSTPDRNRLFMRFANIFPLLEMDSADDPISSIQHLRCNRKSQGFCSLQIDSEL